MLGVVVSRPQAWVIFLYGLFFVYHSLLIVACNMCELTSLSPFLKNRNLLRVARPHSPPGLPTPLRGSVSNSKKKMNKVGSRAPSKRSPIDYRLICNSFFPPPKTHCKYYPKFRCGDPPGTSMGPQQRSGNPSSSVRNTKQVL